MHNLVLISHKIEINEEVRGRFLLPKRSSWEGGEEGGGLSTRWDSNLDKKTKRWKDKKDKKERREEDYPQGGNQI